MNYDPEARRDTPLALRLKARIRSEGPISVGEYMRVCLGDPEHGYYVTQQAIGAKGDFITAPEISQVFGELIGLWCAVVWQQMGSPERFALIELGPGRGTLMRDALRAARVVPRFLDAAHVTLIETNEVLQEEQRKTLRHAGLVGHWARHLGPDAETGADHLDRNLTAIVLANEYLDTCGVDQLVRRGGGWSRRTVELDAAGNLCFGLGEIVHDRPLPQLERLGPAPEGTVLECWAWHHDASIGALLRAFSRAAMLFIDYGHVETAPGDTLQAVRAHRYEHPLTSPGEADLTAHVDFQDLASTFATAGFAVDGPVTQGEFLGALGIMERASRLMAANPARAAEIEAGVARLMAVPGMGSRFKAIGMRSPELPPLPGFPVDGRG